MLSNLILVASATDAASKSKSSPLSFLPLLLIVLVGYLLLVRPARVRQRKALENRAALEPGAEVTTTAGLIATVVSVDDDGIVTLEVAPGVHSRYVKAAIARVHTPFEDEPEGEPLTGAHEEIPAEDNHPPEPGPPTGSTGTDEPEPDAGKPWSASSDPNDH